VVGMKMRVDDVAYGPVARELADLVAEALRHIDGTIIDDERSSSALGSRASRLRFEPACTRWRES
jgi:hypothetical protein